MQHTPIATKSANTQARRTSIIASPWRGWSRASGAAVSSIIAAVLHDCIEDTELTFEEVFDHFGQSTAILVLEITSPATVKDCLRDVRHQVNLAHLKKISAQAATIKIADIIDNTSTIHERDSKFALTYLSEKWGALDVLGRGNPDLHARARTQVISNLMAAKHSLYPLPLGPYSGGQYIMPPSEYERDIFAIVQPGDDGGIVVTWRNGAWQHSNLDFGRLMWAPQLSSHQLAQAGIPAG